jgi:tetratricopeptide (TPR) repeat protein
VVRREVHVKDIPAEAQLLHQQGRQAGAAREYDKALVLLKRASRLAPKWPYPIYDMAYTFLLMQDTANATECYRKTVELSPRGFFTAITALDTLEREQRGDIPNGTYQAYLSLDAVTERTKKVEMMHHLVAQTPRFAPAWNDIASGLDDDVDKIAAIEKGLAAEPDAETKGMLLINKALVLSRAGDREVASKILRELALDSAATYRTEHLAKWCLAMVSRKQ